MRLPGFVQPATSEAAPNLPPGFLWAASPPLRYNGWLPMCLSPRQGGSGWEWMPLRTSVLPHLPSRVPSLFIQV